ncbi:MAG: HEXXH motif-containing putative peptide modification protein [Coxiellaceae bacterium]|nr:HEXXH motif-containing putative peptide modification protein [Coxiellaceae bacterium]
MHQSLFNATPNTSNADELNRLSRKIICEKLASIQQQLSQQLEIDLTDEVQRFNQYKHNGIVNPALFFYYFKIKKNVTEGNLDIILDTLCQLNAQPINLSRKHQPNISSALNTSWEIEMINDKARQDVISPFGMENNYEVVRPVFNHQIELQQQSIVRAIDMLAQSDKTHIDSALHNLYAIKLFEGSIRAFSYQGAFGQIYIRVPQESDHPIAYYLEHIVHECAHQYLFALQLLDPVVLNKPNELYNAPIRVAKRPMSGIFHACFVLSRMVRCFRKTKDYFEGSLANDFNQRIDQWFNQSYDVVKQHAQLTDRGRHLFESLRDCAYE